MSSIRMYAGLVLHGFAPMPTCTANEIVSQWKYSCEGQPLQTIFQDVWPAWKIRLNRNPNDSTSKYRNDPDGASAGPLTSDYGGTAAPDWCCRSDQGERQQPRTGIAGVKDQKSKTKKLKRNTYLYLGTYNTRTINDENLDVFLFELEGMGCHWSFWNKGLRDRNHYPVSKSVPSFHNWQW